MVTAHVHSWECSGLCSVDARTVPPLYYNVISLVVFDHLGHARFTFGMLCDLVRWTASCCSWRIPGGVFPCHWKCHCTWCRWNPPSCFVHPCPLWLSSHHVWSSCFSFPLCRWRPAASCRSLQYVHHHKLILGRRLVPLWCSAGLFAGGWSWVCLELVGFLILHSWWTCLQRTLCCWHLSHWLNRYFDTILP